MDRREGGFVHKFLMFASGKVSWDEGGEGGLAWRDIGRGELVQRYFTAAAVACLENGISKTADVYNLESAVILCYVIIRATTKRGG